MLALVACGGGNSGTSSTAPATPATPTSPATYSMSGAVSGLVGTLVLQNNGADNLTVSVNGPITFANQLASGGTYAITVLTQPSGSTCVVKNATGTIDSGNISNITVVCTVNQSSGGGDSGGGNSGGGTSGGGGTSTYTVSATVSGLVGTAVLQNNGGNNLSVSTNGVATFSTALANGATYAVTVLTKPASQICTVSNGTGTIASANVTNITVVCTGYAYVTNKANNYVSMYAVDSLGALTPLSTPTVLTGTTGASPFNIAVNAAGTFAYVTNYSRDNVAMYSIPSNGILTPLSTPTVSTGTGPRAIAINPARTFAYVTNWDGGNGSTVSNYSINPSTGILSLISASTMDNNGVSDIAINSAGTFAYVTSETTSNIEICDINLTTGEVNQIGTTSPVRPQTFIVISPNGKFLYATNYSNNSVTMFSINQITGAILPLTPPTIATGVNPGDIVINPAGTFAYVANNSSDTISMYAIDSVSGVLTPLLVPTRATGPVPYGLAINAAGTFAYVTNSGNAPGGNSVWRFAIDPVTGQLGLGAPVAIGLVNPTSIVVRTPP